MNFLKRPRWAHTVLIAAAAAAVSFAQSTDPAQDNPPPAQVQAPSAVPGSTQPSTPPVDPSILTTPQQPDPNAPPDRVFGVLPNFRTADRTLEGTTISWKEKLDIARKDSFDYPLVGLAAVLAGIGQWHDENPSFGQGLKGYAHRWATGYADQAIGNMFTEGFMPALLHEDPRYFRRGSGSASYRTMYAISRIMVTKTDSGHTRFNYSEWVGNAASTAISNLYYPDGRTASDNALRLVQQCGVDAFSQVLKEFWPDLKKKLTHK